MPRDTAPLLILAHNRPHHLSALIQSLRSSSPAHVIIAVDGARKYVDGEASLVSDVKRVASEIPWKAKVEHWFHEENLGLKTAVATAVTRATSEYGQVVVVEDDVVVGPLFLDYMQHSLDTFKNCESVAHINGYNVAPANQFHINSYGSRLTIYPESFAWATWHRAWCQYDPELRWAKNVSIDDLALIVGSKAGALKWKNNFEDAAHGRINSWAYRWLATIWSKNWEILSPNSNLVSYRGHDTGTHTFRKPRWLDLETADEIQTDLVPETLKHHPEVDRWIGRTVFNETWFGVIEGLAVSSVLSLRKKIHPKT